MLANGNDEESRFLMLGGGVSVEVLSKQKNEAGGILTELMTSDDFDV